MTTTQTPGQELRRRQAARATNELRDALRDLIRAANDHLDGLPTTSLQWDEVDQAVAVTSKCREAARFLRGEG